MAKVDMFGRGEKSGIKMTGVSKTSPLNFVVFVRFLALTAKV